MQPAEAKGEDTRAAGRKGGREGRGIVASGGNPALQECADGRVLHNQGGAASREEALLLWGEHSVGVATC